MTFSMPASTSRSSTAADLVLAGADAGQVGHRRQARLALDPLHQLDGLGARRTARAVGHRHERRRQLGEVADGPLQRLRRRRRSWAERTRTRTSRRSPAGTARRSSLCALADAAEAPPMRSRCAAIAAASTVTVSPLRSGASNMTSWQISSTMVRRLRAPVRRRRQYCGDRPQALVGEAQVDAVHLQQRLVLAHHRVGRAGHDQVQVVLGQRLELDTHGQPAEELGEEAVVEQLLLGDAAGGRRRRRPDRRRSRPASAASAGAGRRTSPPR